MTTSTTIVRLTGDARRSPRTAHEPRLRRELREPKPLTRRNLPERSQRTQRVAPPGVFYIVAGVVTVLTMLGLAMVMAASSIKELHAGRSPWGIFTNQSVLAVVGVGVLVAAMRIPLALVRRLSVPFLLVSLAAMAIPLTSRLGHHVNGAKAWISSGGQTLQPSEFAKLAVLVFCAHLLASRSGEMEDLRRTLKPVLWVAAIACGMCMLQGDLGSGIVLAAIVLTMLFLAGTPWRPLVTAALVGAAGAGMVIASSPFRRARFTAFLDVAAHSKNYSYQTYQAMIALAQGGFAGEGVGRGRITLGGYLPVADSDFIFAVIGEQLGFVGMFAVIAAFVLLAYAGMQIALMATDPFARLVASGVAAWFVVQALINIGGVVGMMPVTGLTLPFMSRGGSSLLVSMAAAGLLLNIGRRVR